MRNDVDFPQQSFSGTWIQMAFLCRHRGFLTSDVALVCYIFVACVRTVLSRCLHLPLSLVFLSWCVSVLSCSCFLTRVVFFSVIILSVSIRCVCAVWLHERKGNVNTHPLRNLFVFFAPGRFLEETISVWAIPRGNYSEVLCSRALVFLCSWSLVLLSACLAVHLCVCVRCLRSWVHSFRVCLFWCACVSVFVILMWLVSEPLCCGCCVCVCRFVFPFLKCPPIKLALSHSLPSSCHVSVCDMYFWAHVQTGSTSLPRLAPLGSRRSATRFYY